MADLVGEFLSKFHSLEGLTLASRKKNLFELLHQCAPLFKVNPELLDDISTNLKPKTYLEGLFKVDFLIYFRRSQDLFQLLKEGNDAFVGKILKQAWFFEMFVEVSPEDFLSELSFSVRMKVLRKLSRYLPCEKFEKIFDTVLGRYGIFIASRFLTGCSSVKIRETLKEYSVKFTPIQLRVAYGKDPELIEFYFDLPNNKNSLNATCYRKFLKFIVKEDPKLFNKIKEKYNIYLKLGRRATKKFVENKKDEIIKNSNDFGFLNMKAVFRKLGSDSRLLVINCLSPQVPDLNKSNWNHLRRFLPTRYHYIYLSTFEKHFNIKYSDYPEFIDENFLEVVTDNVERSILAKIKLNEGYRFDSFIKYLQIDNSVSLLKEKIHLTTNIDERCKLVRMLSETWAINNDLNALLSIMEYFYSNHRNDDLKVRYQFIRGIETYYFKFKNFTNEIWTYLNDLLFDPEKKTIISAALKLAYLEFLFNKNEPIDHLILDYYKIDYLMVPCSNKYDKNFVKHFLLFTLNNVSKNTTETCDVQFNDCLVRCIIFWNQNFKNDQLSFYDFPSLITTFKYMLKTSYIKGSRCYTYIFRPFIKTIRSTGEKKFRDEYLNIYWERFDHYGDIFDLKWFFNHDPLLLISNFDKLFTTLIDKNRFQMWYFLKKSSHLELDQKIISECLSKLSDQSCLEMKQKFVPCLSILMDPEDFAAFADSYKPINKKLDLKNEVEVRKYNLHSAIAKNFKNAKNYTVLTALLNYCKGDYFKNAKNSLYSILFRTPENMLPRYLNYLSKQAVSVRKHALYLTCELSTCAKIKSVIKVLHKREKVQSLQKYICSATVKYFAKNPSDSFFELVKLSMQFICKADAETLNRAITHDILIIPQNYKGEYIEYTWNYLETIFENWAELRLFKQDILTALTGTTQDQIRRRISLQFGLKVIQEHFIGEKELDYMNVFILDLLTDRDEKTAIFETVFTILDNCEDEDRMFSFLHYGHYRIMQSQNTDLKKYFEPYIIYYEKKISITKHFHDFIRIFFLKMKLESSEVFSVDDFVERVVGFFKDIVDQCGPHVIHLFAREMSSNFDYFRTNTISSLNLYYSMIKNYPVPMVAVLVVEALPETVYFQTTEIYQEIAGMIRNIDDVGVQVRLECKLHPPPVLKQVQAVFEPKKNEMEVDEEAVKVEEDVMEVEEENKANESDNKDEPSDGNEESDINAESYIMSE